MFGPVPSRRLGRSLGVDLVPLKVCTFDCTYCQLGRTTDKTLRRAEYVPTDAIIADLDEKLREGPRPDYITLSGSGEPTLHARLGEIIAGAKRLTDIPVVVLTNGSLLWDTAVSDDSLEADLVLPSLDAGDEPTFQQINRPCLDLGLAQIVEGQVKFREAFAGEIWLEVFFLAGVNTGDKQVEKIRSLAERIAPDRLQLNTAVRPTADADARAVTPDELEALARQMGPRAEVIADFHRASDEQAFAAKREDVLDMLRRRPCTVADIAAGLGIHRNEVLKHVGKLSRDGHIRLIERDGRQYYHIPQASGGR